MKVLLIDIPLDDVNNGFAVVHKEIMFPSLGLYYLKEYAQNQLAEIEIKVLNLSNLKFSAAVDKVCAENPTVIGVTVYTDRRKLAFDFINAIKIRKPEVIAIVGGPHATALPRQILEHYSFIDYIVVGEGEITFAELLNSLKTGCCAVQEINGLAFRKDGKVIITQPRALVMNLDELGYPRFENACALPADMIKFTHYDGRFEFHGRKISELKTMSVITSRGCPFQCVYCSTTAFWGRKVRYRSPANVVEEIEYLRSKHNIEFINFVDDAFTIDKSRCIEICNLLISKKLGICWICETNVKTIDNEMLALMKKAGCFAINYGVESGAPAVLKNIKKNITESEIVNAIKLARKNDIIPDIFLMVGNPGENSSTITETLKILRKSRPSSGGWGILTVFPATELYYNCVKTGYINDEYWLTDYSSPFYIKEHSYLQLRIFLSRLRGFFLVKNKNYRLWLRYKILEFRDWLFLKTGVKLSLKRGIELNTGDKSRFKADRLSEIFK